MREIKSAILTGGFVIGACSLAALGAAMGMYFFISVAMWMFGGVV